MKKYNIFIILIMFVAIYAPVLFNISLIHIAGVISWLYIFINYKNLNKIFKTKSLLKLCSVFFILWGYVFLVSIYNGNSWNQGIHYLYWLLEYIPISIMVSVYLIKNKYNIVDLINMLLLVGLIQAITAFLAFINPAIQNFFVNQLVQYGYTETFLALTSLRMYGFSTGLTFSTPIFQSVLAVIAIFLAINKNWKYSLFIPILLFSGIINARISIVILLVGLVAIILCLKPSIKKMLRISALVVISGIAIKYLLEFIEKNMSNTYEWIMTGYEEIVLFLQGDTSGYFNYVSNSQKYPLPPDNQLFLGVGARIMGANRYNQSTDIGYINDLWLGGLIYCFLLCILILYMLYRISKISDEFIILNKFLALFFLGVIAVSNIKGFVIGKNDFMVIFFFVYVYLVLTRRIGLKGNFEKGI